MDFVVHLIHLENFVALIIAHTHSKVNHNSNLFKRLVSGLYSIYKKIVEIWREYIGERNEFEFDFNGVKRCKHLHLDYTVFIKKIKKYGGKL